MVSRAERFADELAGVDVDGDECSVFLILKKKKNFLKN